MVTVKYLYQRVFGIVDCAAPFGGNYNENKENSYIFHHYRFRRYTFTFSQRVSSPQSVRFVEEMGNLEFAVVPVASSTPETEPISTITAVPSDQLLMVNGVSVDWTERNPL